MMSKFGKKWHRGAEDDDTKEVDKQCRQPEYHITCITKRLYETFQIVRGVRGLLNWFGERKVPEIMKSG